MWHAEVSNQDSSDSLQEEVDVAEEFGIGFHTIM